MNLNCVLSIIRKWSELSPFCITFFFSSQMIDPIAEVAMEVPIYWGNLDLWLAGICIIFNPLFWNIVSLLVYVVVCSCMFLYTLRTFEMFF